MPLSEFEKRELERISNGLGKDDPRLAVLLGQDAFMLILVVGLMLKAPLLGITGFAVMSAAGYWSTTDVCRILAGGRQGARES
ncbi:DUF3040 domain-containing protein [Arthrobacter sp. 9AX]|uniref:DUF3040 domain-containing protein n=1 Tax=Arthrobacter sp. 9AX TaxID=2653131 RepID=UPI00135C1D85|nr:DUF3040 domain-containing protein [Arthrobacter sp. 9AX]